MQQEGSHFRSILILLDVEKQHAFDDASIRPDNRLDIDVAPTDIIFLIGHQITEFFPVITIIL